MTINTAEENIHEALLGVADLAQEYVDGVDVKKRMKKQLAKLAEAWADLADAIIEGGAE